MSKITFNNRDNEFYINLKIAVDNYFETKNIKKTGNWHLFSKTIILVGAAIAIYFCLVMLPLTTIPALILAGILGFLFASIGFAVMHDANHGSYSSNARLNDLIGLSANAMGASSYFW